MKRIILLFIASITISSSFAQKNLTALGTLVFPGQRLSGCWHYNDGSSEYAIVGAEQGIAIVDITNPSTPNLLFQLPGVTSLWHEVKVLGKFAFAVSEGTDSLGITDGLQIINLTYLPDSAPTFYYHGDGAIANMLHASHSITAEGHYVYLNGHNITTFGSRGVIILDVSDPTAPVYVGNESNRYCHDSFVRGDTMFTSDISDGMFSIYDITNRANPVLLQTQLTPGQFTHNTWLSDDSKYLFSADEKIQTPVGSFDISDYNNIDLIDSFYNDTMSNREVHNVRVFHDFLINPSYGSQLTLVDISRPNNMIEIGNYPVGSFLCWDADPYTNSGNIIATDVNSFTLFVFAPSYIHACYLEGTVTDSITGLTLAGVAVNLTSLAISDQTGFDGKYATGYADSGTYTVSFSLTGYFTQQITVTLSNGVLTPLNVKLVPLNAFISFADHGGIKIYPNPTRENVQLTSEEVVVKWSLIDVQGRVVGTSMPGTYGKITIPTGNLAKGVYNLEVEKSSGREYRKLVLQ